MERPNQHPSSKERAEQRWRGGEAANRNGWQREMRDADARERDAHEGEAE